MCFGKKEKQLYNDNDDAPRPAPGQFPQQPTYASTPSTKPSMPQQNSSYDHQQQQPPAQPYYAAPPSAVSPVTPVYANPPPGPPPQQQHQYNQHPPAVELSAVTQANPPAELSGSTDYAPPPGPPPSHAAAAAAASSSFSPPPGPPPTNNDYAPPPGPPPTNNDYAPPPGPPPSQSHDYTAPPPGPPPEDDTKKHNWEAAVPDTSLFPPPPALFSGWYASPTTNATEAEANAGEAWCASYPLTAPLQLDARALAALERHDITLMKPQANFSGAITRAAPGVWTVSSDGNAKDSCVIGYPPLYSVLTHSPLMASNAEKRAAEKTVYFEVRLAPVQKERDICLAIGFTALPYPSFRMPGWHRGSLAVHGDDGHKYINDRWGGKSFTEPFRPGETYGIGITFRQGAKGGGIDGEVFFTRQGRIAGSWDVHEEIDAEQDGPVFGLEGYHDLSCAIGTFKAIAFDVVFDPAMWAYKPSGC